MFTMEQKVNLVLRYIATTDDTQRSELKSRIVEALREGATTPIRNNPDIEDVIAGLLKEIGMPTHLLGYDYTVCAIKLIISDHNYTREITTRLYPDIAVRYNTTRSRVERAMRHAIEVAFDRCDFEVIYDLFGNTISFHRGKLTNSEFISACANEIARRLKKLDSEVA